MKLDRNTNRGGHGKYALVNMRKLIPLFEKEENGKLTTGELAILQCFRALVMENVISCGNETPGDQFFVMKYKDKFTAQGLRGYATAIADELKDLTNKAERIALSEYCAQMFDECHAAEELGNRIPD
jgi:hypothetical protein